MRALLERVLALPAAQREAVLGDAALAPALVAEVRSLLAHEVDEEHDDFLSRPAALDALPEPANEPEPGLQGMQGRMLGPWRITGRLGAGGRALAGLDAEGRCGCELGFLGARLPTVQRAALDGGAEEPAGAHRAVPAVDVCAGA